MNFPSLLIDPMFPVIRKDGTRDIIALCDLTSKVQDNPIVSLDFARSDFEVFGLEIFIGTLQTLFTPADDKKWLHLLKNPPTPADLRKAFKPEASIFRTDSFMQAPSTATFKEDATTTVALLLSEQPGKTTIENERDFLHKNRNGTVMCPICTMVSLYGHNIHAGAGGNRHNRSPLCCAANLAATGTTLWETVWFNVLPATRISGDPKTAYPWLKPYETEINSLDDYGAWWIMPRRVRAVFLEGSETCSICGEETKVFVKTVMRHSGTAHKLEDFKGPLTLFWPETKSKDGAVRKAKMTRITVDKEDHLSVAQSPNHAACEYPAAVRRLQELEIAPAGLRIFGPDFDQMPIKQWHDSWHPWADQEQLREAIKERDRIVLIVARLVTQANAIKEYDATPVKADMRNRIAAIFDAAWKTGSWQEKLAEIAVASYDRYTSQAARPDLTRIGRFSLRKALSVDLPAPARLPRPVAKVQSDFIMELMTWWSSLQYRIDEASSLAALRHSANEIAEAQKHPLLQGRSSLNRRYLNSYGYLSDTMARKLTELALVLVHVRTNEKTRTRYEGDWRKLRATMMAEKRANIPDLAKAMLAV